jgi:hypothetical protein
VKETLKINEVWAEIFAELAILVSKKNLSYGDSLAQSVECMRILYPDGISSDKYYDALVTLRIFDKLARIAKDKSAFSESPWMDLAGYSVLAYREDLK